MVISFSNIGNLAHAECRIITLVTNGWYYIPFTLKGKKNSTGNEKHVSLNGVSLEATVGLWWAFEGANESWSASFKCKILLFTRSGTGSGLGLCWVAHYPLPMLTHMVIVGQCNYRPVSIGAHLSVGPSQIFCLRRYF